MNINKINGGNFSEKEIKKSSQSAFSVSAGAESKADSSSNAGKGDRFSPSSVKLTGDFDLAQNELKKLDGGSFSKLRKIKAKISQGKYNSEEVHKNIASLVEKDMGSLEQVLSTSSKSVGQTGSSGSSSISPEYKEFLLENPNVFQKVADGVVADLKKL